MTIEIKSLEERLASLRRDRKVLDAEVARVSRKIEAAKSEAAVRAGELVRVQCESCDGSGEVSHFCCGDDVPLENECVECRGYGFVLMKAWRGRP